MKTFRIIIALFYALLCFTGICFFGLLAYSEFTDPYNIIITSILIVIALYTSGNLFTMMRRRGVMGVMSGNNASYELDELEPVQGSGTQKLTAQELYTYFNEGKLDWQPTSISIYGDWEGRELNKRHQLQSIELDEKKDILTLSFQSKCLLRIKKPRTILCASTYLKITKATEVLWQVPAGLNKSNHYKYLNTGKTITTKSNTDWKPHKYDVGIGMQAVYLQG